MNFNSDSIELFLAVIERGSFSAAARALGRVPSAVSMGIANLEAELGYPLFDRSHREPYAADAVGDERQRTQCRARDQPDDQAQHTDQHAFQQMVDTAQEEVQDSAPASGEEPAPAPAADAPPTAQEQQKAHAERVLTRIESAIAFAAEQQARSIVLLGHGSGAYWAARYLAERQPAEVRNLLVVAASVPAGYTPPLDELIPQLQLATGDFYYKDQLLDRQAATRRMQASKRQKHPSYIQIAMKALPGNLEAEQEQLYRRLRGWLTLKIQAK